MSFVFVKADKGANVKVGNFNSTTTSTGVEITVVEAPAFTFRGVAYKHPEGSKIKVVQTQDNTIKMFAFTGGKWIETPEERLRET